MPGELPGPDREDTVFPKKACPKPRDMGRKGGRWHVEVRRGCVCSRQLERMVP